MFFAKIDDNVRAVTGSCVEDITLYLQGKIDYKSMRKTIEEGIIKEKYEDVYDLGYIDINALKDTLDKEKFVCGDHFKQYFK
ncbi:MAG: hypothetical protein JW700_03565 [Candidatus Aenigmarchaeota archaeon]|nr:hypothetical protein [Candidatus Aenigmarchaeota archaeon]